MAALLAVCDGAWDMSSGALSCAGTVSVVDLSNVLTTFSLSQLDPAVVAQAFAAGFSLVAVFHLVGIAASEVINSFNR